MRTSILVFVTAAVLASFALTGTAYAQESSNSGDGYKFLSAGLAFGLAALGAGIGLAYVVLLYANLAVIQ